MSIEYNSILIAKLYSAKEEDEIINILDEIGQIGDPIFLYPVFEVYKKNIDKSISLFFISSIYKLNSNDVLQVALEIGKNPLTGYIDKIYTLNIFDNRKYYDEDGIKIALLTLQDFIRTNDRSEFNLYSIIPYLKNADQLSNIKEDLWYISTSENYNLKSREYAFEKWLEIDPKKNLQTIIDDIDELKQNPKQEAMIARVISNWTGTLTEKLKNIIEENGGAEAKQIIKRSREKKEEEKNKLNIDKQIVVKTQFSNSDLLERICILREKINDAAKSNQNIGFSIFPQNESLLLQMKTANDDATLIKACVGLRDVLQNLNNDLENHGLATEEIKKILPHTAVEDFNKSINKLFIFLHSKKFNIDSNLFGLRQLNQLVGLIGAHPRSEKEAITKKLQNVNLEKAYQDEDYVKIHQSLLELYQKSLSGLLEALKGKN